MKNKRKRTALLAPLATSMIFTQMTPLLANEVDFDQADLSSTATETNNAGSLYELQQTRKALENEIAIQGSSPELEAQLAQINERIASYATQEMYRLYNPNSGEHFYTADKNEQETLVRVGWQDEGIGWYAPSRQGVPVYRLYNPNGEHHYTTSAAERDNLVSVGWKYEGEGWKSLTSEDAFGQPLYRQYNPNQQLCNHNYTTSLGEHQALIGLGWKDEGIGWTGVDVIYQENVNGNLRIYKTDTMEQIFGLYTYGGQSFYLDPANGGIAVKNGKCQINGKTYLFDDQGQMIRSKGWVDFGGQRYWINDDGSLATGLVFVSKEQTGEASHYLVFDDQGSLIRNGQTGGYQTDANGWLTNPNGDQMMKQFCHDTYAKTGRDLEAMFRYVGDTLTYVKKDPAWFEPAPGLSHVQNYAYLGFTTSQGNCFSYAAMFVHLAREAGYEIRFVKGQVATIYGNNVDHGWTEIKINGQWYICDPNFYEDYPFGYTYMRPIDRTPFTYIRPADAYNFQ